MEIKSYFGIKPRPEISLEAQVMKTTFRSSYPEVQITYNEWTEYIWRQLNSKKKRKRAKKVM